MMGYLLSIIIFLINFATVMHIYKMSIYILLNLKQFIVGYHHVIQQIIKLVQVTHNFRSVLD